MSEKGIAILPLGIKTTTGKIDIDLVTEHKLYPINTRFCAEDSRNYRYIVDEKGYRWIGEELWQLSPKR